MPRWNSVSGARLAKRTAMSPKAVARPVAVVSATPVPLTTEVPRKTQLCASAKLSVGESRSSASLSTGSDSPVNAACWTCRTAEITRHELAAWQLNPCAIAQHSSRRRHFRAQFLDRILRLIGLDKVQNIAEQ